MKQRTAVIAVLAVFVLSCAAFAQNAAQGPKKGGRNEGMGAIAKQLNLTNDQVQSITNIVKKYHADVRDVAKSGATKEEKQSQIKALRQSARQSIMGLLSADQQAKAAQMKLVDRLLNPRPAGKLFGILSKLNLNDQQKASVKSIMKESADKIKAVRQDSTLTPDARQIKCKEIREDTISRIKEQLTSDQLQKFNELMQKQQSRKQK